MTKIQELLFQNEDCEYKDFHAKLMPTICKEKIIGVRVPVIRKLAKDLFVNEIELVNNFFNELPHKYYEENNLHAFLIEQIKDFDECLSLTEKFLPFIDNWATCDSFKPKVFKKNLPAVLDFSKKWLKSSEVYTIRFGIGCLMNYFLDDEFSPTYFDLVCNVKSDEYYVKMMQAWYFATALTKQYNSALQVIKEKKLDLWTHNKAIQKAIESYRISTEYKTQLRAMKRLS